MERLAADLSALSRAEGGRTDLQTERLDLSSMAAEAAERLRPQFDDQRVDLAVETTTSTSVAGDRDRIGQILTNLIGNALSYTPAGGDVTVRASRTRRMAQVAVSDTGRGLTADQLNMVFERFYRADRSVPGGTGIGLTIARSLARAHGGDVMASSPGLGKGATFTLSLPIESTEPDEALA